MEHRASHPGWCQHGGSGERGLGGRCLSYGQEISLWLLADVIRSLFGMREQEPPEEVRITLSSAIASLLSGQDAGTQADAMDVVGEVLGLPPGNSMLANAGAQVRRQALIRSLRLVLAAVSQRAPTMLVLEDLHWIDRASQEVLTEILADGPGLRLLVLAAQRPGSMAPWSEWSWPERLTVRPLGEREAATLAQAVLGGVLLSEDYEYERHGTANLFLWFEPLAGRRHVEVTKHRTRLDWAGCIRDLVNVHYPDAERIVLVLDNLNIHSPASLYAAFEPARAKRIADQLEIHHTPKHGSWLNAAEIELAILTSQCLDRHIPDRETLTREGAAWEAARNPLGAGVNWRFTTEDARIKLRRLYPTY